MEHALPENVDEKCLITIELKQYRCTNAEK
jgi:hypothetical protein